MDRIVSALVSIAIGVAVLLYGRRINWFAAAAGFLIGLGLMHALFPASTLLTALLVAIALGVGGFILGTFGTGIMRLLFRIMGALAGAAITLWLLRLFGLDTGVLGLAGLVVGGLIGFVLIQRYFELGVIVLTSLLGASLIVGGVNTVVPLGNVIATAATLGVAVLGFLFQRTGRFALSQQGGDSGGSHA
jgi:hypothetical protein